MGRLIRAHDWAATALGPLKTWPTGLKTAASIMLGSRHPMFIWWGPELINLYNDAYSSTLGERHPRALGRPAPEVWSEIWDILGPRAEQVLSRGEGVYDEELQLMLDREGLPKETYWTLSHSPIPHDGDGAIGGVFGAVSDETSRIIGEARLKAAVDLQGLGLFSWDVETGVLAWDGATRAMWGLEPGAPIDFFSAIEAVSPEDRDRLLADLANSLDPGGDRVYGGEFRITGIGDGVERWIAVRGRTSFRNGRPVGMTGVNADITERKHIEAAMRANEARLRDAAELAGLAPFVWDLETGRAEWSESTKAVFGLAPDEPATMDVVRAAVHPDDRASVDAAMAQAIDPTGDGVYHAEHRVTRRDGEERWVACRGRATFRDGRAVAVTGAVREITDEKRAEARLSVQKARLQTAIDLVGLGIYAWDPQAKAMTFDARCKAMWGLAPDARIDLATAMAAVHCDDRPKLEAAIAKCIEPPSYGFYEAEFCVVGIGDGVERWVISRGQIEVVDGRPVGISGFALDISASRSAQAQLRESEARLTAIVQQLPAGVALFDRAGRLIQANDAGRRYVAGDQMPSRHADSHRRWRAFDNEGQELDTSHYPGERALKGELVTPGVDFIHSTDEDRETWVRVSAAPFRDDNGAIAGVISVMQDVDQEKRAQQMNLLLISELQHRTRNLLALVDSIATETMASSGSIDEFIVTFGGRLAAISRAQGLLSRLASQPATIGELIGQQLRALGAEPDGVRVIADGPEIPLPDRTVQILALAVYELITNARKYGALRGPGGRLEVRWGAVAAPDGRRLELSWRENRASDKAVGPECPGSGFGRMLIEESLPHQLDAETKWVLQPEGLCCWVSILL
jgi:PAS domain S-box-containing protein